MIRFLYGKLKNSERGASLLEFAITIPILLALVFGIIEFVWILNGHITLSGALREGVRIAVVSDHSNKGENEIRSDIRKTVIDHAKTFQLKDGEDGDIKIEFGDYGEETIVWVEEAKLPLLVGFFPYIDNPYVIGEVKATMMHE